MQQLCNNHATTMQQLCNNSMQQFTFLHNLNKNCSPRRGDRNNIRLYDLCRPSLGSNFCLNCAGKRIVAWNCCIIVAWLLHGCCIIVAWEIPKSRVFLLSWYYMRKHISHARGANAVSAVSTAVKMADWLPQRLSIDGENLSRHPRRENLQAASGVGLLVAISTAIKMTMPLN